MSKLSLRIGALLIGMGLVIFLICSQSIGPRILAGKSGLLTVTFLDVGQGDAILIETMDGVQVLIDGGPDGSVIRQLSSLLSPFDHAIDMVIGTHPDKDHIGGLIDVFNRYEVAAVLVTENRGETLASSAYDEALKNEAASFNLARAGQVWQLGALTTLTIYSPASDPSLLESNAASIVAKLQYGEIGFMLTGDAPAGIEDYLARTYKDQLESEVLKLGHHGSRTSTSEAFLAAVRPDQAVVSAGQDNSYGHPHPEVISRVADRGIEIVTTAELGNITFVTDGETVWRR